MINLLFSNPLAFIIIFPGLLMSISLHEFFHCLAADKLGDPTPRAKGRLTLDPRVHLDPLGVVAILLTRYGWGKPAPYDPYNLKEPVRDTALIALAGPVSNLTIAVILSMLVRFAIIPLAFVNVALVNLIIINVILAIFNLLPIHPLDGSKVLMALLPKTTALEYEGFMSRYGTLILIIFIFPMFGSVSPASKIVLPVANALLSMLL